MRILYRLSFALLLMVAFPGAVFSQQTGETLLDQLRRSQGAAPQVTQPAIGDQQMLPPQTPARPLTPSQPREPQRPGETPLSEFERFASEEVLEIDEFQFAAIEKFPEIAFSQTSRGKGINHVAVPLRVMKKATTPAGVSAGPVEAKTQVMEAGYLIGTPEALSSAFKILGLKTPLSLSTGLRQLGYELFKQPPSAFAATDNLPLGPEYVVGPGDEIRISLWGKVEGQWAVVVDRDGTIRLPKAGVLGVAGLTFRELKEVLYKEMSKYYTGFEMNVSLGALRSFKVYVVGDVVSPGAYAVSALSTIVNAIFVAGGPTKAGSMRDIQLKRNGRTVVHFDLYDLLLRGDKSRDERLMPEDVIYVPPIGPVAAIAGNVNRPAIYELRGEKKVSELIDMAGGMNAIAFQGRVQVERITSRGRQIVFESDIEELKDKEIPLQSGDVVKIYQAVDDKRVVRLTGSVSREGEYGYSPGMTVRDLIEKAGGLKYYANKKEAELTRVYVTDKGPRTEKIIVNLERALAGDMDVNIRLKDDDYLFVRSVPEWKLYKTVTIAGEVKYPGTYTITKGERFSELVVRAGGVTDMAYLKGTVFTRASTRQLQQQQLDESINRFEKQLLSISAGKVETALAPEEAAQQRLFVQQQMDLLAKMRAAKAKGRIALSLTTIEDLRASPYDVELQEGDDINIPAAEGAVNVMGAVYNQTAFVYSPGATVGDYVRQAGGVTTEGDDSEMFVLKVNGAATSRKQGGMWWNPETKRLESGSFTSMPLDPGDTVVVPPKLERIAWLKEIKDITQIIFQIAVAAGVVINAF